MKYIGLWSPGLQFFFGKICKTLRPAPPPPPPPLPTYLMYAPLGKLCFKEQFQADSFLVVLIFILFSHISQGDSLVTFEMDYMLLF